MCPGSIMIVFLLVLIAATFLWVWVDKQQVSCKKWANAVAIFAVIVSLLGVLGSAYKMTCNKSCDRTGGDCAHSDKYCTKKDCDKRDCHLKHKDKVEASDKSAETIIETKAENPATQNE